ncbi:lysophospholipid acyltransferase family protein [Arenibacter sp. F20364]|nr:lysophospholipid acyltransferase family protein [Arenibacter sp. F20364]
MRTALIFYFSKIKIEGLPNVPSGKPIMFLANHQNALLDALLIATHCNRKPYFLTRSDVFKTSVLKIFFEFLQMVPVYRIRDGKDSLKGNNAIFERCSNLLQNGEVILVFPEGNHSLKRRVRPLSKGFTRILFMALESNPSLDIGIIPIGVNYAKAAKFPDKAALYFGKEIKVQEFFHKEDLLGSANRLKEEVYQRLKKLTTHIEVEEGYSGVLRKLNKANVDYLSPATVNLLLEEDTALASKTNVRPRVSAIKYLYKYSFVVLNLPVVLLWTYLIKPKVSEPEFMSTSRFMFALIFYPFFYLIMFLGMLAVLNVSVALIICLVHLTLSIVLVKLF